MEEGVNLLVRSNKKESLQTIIGALSFTRLGCLKLVEQVDSFSSFEEIENFDIDAFQEEVTKNHSAMVDSLLTITEALYIAELHITDEVIKPLKVKLWQNVLIKDNHKQSYFAVTAQLALVSGCLKNIQYNPFPDYELGTEEYTSSVQGKLQGISDILLNAEYTLSILLTSS